MTIPHDHWIDILSKYTIVRIFLVPVFVVMLLLCMLIYFALIYPDLISETSGKENNA
jgi:ABC-type dipeptide/oligopeptide/nickel transport system permease component